MADTTFTRMQDATRDDYKIIGRHSLEFFTGLPDRILSHLEILDSDTGGYAVSRLTHSLQTATRSRLPSGCPILKCFHPLATSGEVGR